MNADDGPGLDSGKQGRDVLDYLRPCALVVMIGVSGCLVWAIHSGDAFLISLALFFGSSLGLFAGLIVGVSLPSTMLTLGGFTGLFEGVVRGFTHYGILGAILCGPLGLIAGMVVSVPLMLLLLLFLYLGTGTGAGSAEQIKNE